MDIVVQVDICPADKLGDDDIVRRKSAVALPLLLDVDVHDLLLHKLLQLHPLQQQRCEAKK